MSGAPGGRAHGHGSRRGAVAAQAAFLRRFDAADAHDGDGYASSSAWLAGKTRLSRKDAKAAVRQMRLLGRRPLLDDATAAGDLSRSWGREIAAAAGADLDDLRVIAQAAYEAWRAGRPDPDGDPGKGFGERFVQLDTTMDDAGRMTGDLTPECAAAVRAVLEALGKKRGPEDDRTAAQRFHDALQEGCVSRRTACLMPDQAGADSLVCGVLQRICLHHRRHRSKRRVTLPKEGFGLN